MKSLCEFVELNNIRKEKIEDKNLIVSQDYLLLEEIVVKDEIFMQKDNLGKNYLSTKEIFYIKYRV